MLKYTARVLNIFRFLLLLPLLCMLPCAGNTASLEDGFAAFDTGRYADALIIWTPLAEKGDAEAQYNLGLLYMNGLGVEKNDRTALIWFTRAARQGMADAQYNTGVMYFSGRGVYPSPKDALAWWKLAANKGHPEAQYNLGVMYAYGRATGVDVEKAIGLWKKSARQGNPLAQEALSRAYREGLFGLPKDPALAQAWASGTVPP